MMRNFAIGIFTGLFAVPGAVLAAWLTLALVAPDHVPAPAITRLVHLDEKLRFLRDHPELDPTILAVGSSVTWRQIDGTAFENYAGGPNRFLNGATGYLRVHQTRTVAQFYLSHYPNVNTVLVMLAPPDFSDCTDDPRNMFSDADAARYVFGDWPAAYFYLRYFSPRRYFKMATSLVSRRTPFIGDLYLDRFGSGPVELQQGEDLGLRYGAVDPDGACADALMGLARDIRGRGLRMLLVFTPVHPDYRAKYPRELRWLDRVAARMERMRQRHPDSLTILHLARDDSFAPRDYYDAFHLQWPAAKLLSERIAHALDARPGVMVSGHRHASRGFRFAGHTGI